VLFAREANCGLEVYTAACHASSRPSQPTTTPMKIAVAVLLAIAAARKGINPQPTIDLRYGEIGPDTAKEHIVGAVVFKKEKPEGAWPTDDLKVTFTPKSIEIPARIPSRYEASGELAVKNWKFTSVVLKADESETYIGKEFDTYEWHADWLVKDSDESTKNFAGEIYTEIKNTYDANKTPAGGLNEKKFFNQQGKPGATIEWTMPNKKIQEETDAVMNLLDGAVKESHKKGKQQ